MSLEVRSHKSGATFRLAVRPGAGRTAAGGERDGALRLGLTAAPEKGKANKEALRFMAKALSLPRAQLEIISGETSREKVVLCRGVCAEDLRSRLAALINV